MISSTGDVRPDNYLNQNGQNQSINVSNPAMGLSSPPSAALLALLARAQQAYQQAQTTNPMDVSKLFPSLSSPMATSSFAAPTYNPFAQTAPSYTGSSGAGRFMGNAQGILSNNTTT